ncbi:hypothetical protein [Yoonia sp. I 8.24]|uniref:hypothetical protein n=1 Tax=Yoonia sp. I 8.24 TaxID=1537229 RepID=UPI001EE07701|nr:hypothetical protein [Yoonia sp. I 8.24]MCG3267596.1 hypothetical protein [Yoonia sp. I 8.24]
MKAQELLIHLGHHKTGTTTLQKVLTQSRAAMMEKGIYFPDIYPHSGNGIILGYHLLDDKTDDAVRSDWLKITLAQAQKKSQAEWTKVLDTVERKPPQTVLLSSEFFFSLIGQDTVQRFERLTNNVAQTKTAIAYLRAPDTYFLSAFQQSLKKVRTVQQMSRTRIRDALEPLYNNWSGTIRLHVFDRSAMIDGDIVTDFASKHLPNLDQNDLTRAESTANTSLSAEAMSLLYDCNQGRLNQTVPPQDLINQIMKADSKFDQPTKPRLRPGIAQTLINWSAPDLFWLRDTKDITFPSVDYDTIKSDQSTDLIHFDPVEQFCEVNADRKAALYARAEKRAKLPKTVQRWLANW